jgi:hypothetical protein
MARDRRIKRFAQAATLGLVTATCAGQAAAAGPTIASCPLQPADNVWNIRVGGLPLATNSASFVSTIGNGGALHPDFGAATWDGGPIGIPFVTVPGDQPKVDVTFSYDDDSDPGPYPVPANPPIEGGPQSSGDRHILIVDTGHCLLYELYAAYPQLDGSWHAGSGAIFDLNSNTLRPDTWTSADAAGLPILPGLVRYDEVASGAILHALRFTAPVTQKKHVWPARHDASDDTSATVPPMGQRFRLKASFDFSTYPATVKVILTALRDYGMILADNGSAWYLSGVPDSRWNDDELVTWLKKVPGSAFEAVDVLPVRIDPNSSQAIAATGPPAQPGGLALTSP